MPDLPPSPRVRPRVLDRASRPRRSAVFQVSGFGWSAWKYLADDPGGSILGPSYGDRLSADAAVRHLRPWGRQDDGPPAK